MGRDLALYRSAPPAGRCRSAGECRARPGLSVLCPPTPSSDRTRSVAAPPTAPAPAASVLEGLGHYWMIEGSGQQHAAVPSGNFELDRTESCGGVRRPGASNRHAGSLRDHRRQPRAQATLRSRLVAVVRPVGVGIHVVGDDREARKLPLAQPEVVPR